MKLRIDRLNDITGWTISSPSTLSENEHQQYIAGYDNSKSIALNFSASDTTRIASKTLSSSIDVTNYDTLIFSVWSRNKSSYQYKSASDFNYKIKINSTKEYYLQAYPTFTNVNLGIEEVTEIDRIEITALHSEADSLVISEMIAETQEIGLDLLNEVKEQIEYYLFQAYDDGVNIGQGSGSQGNEYIVIPDNPKYIDRYSVIKIDDGVNNEIHQIVSCDTENFNFNSNFDGAELLHTYVGADIYLQFPVYINPGQMEVRLPGVAIWGIDPDPILRGSKLDLITDTFRVSEDDFKERKDGQILSYTVLIDIESRSVELREKMARVIRKWIAKEVLWINGRYHEIYFESKPIEIRGLEGVDIIPKIQYNLKVEIKEDLFSREIIPKTTDINIIADITT
jgi:hypothetical protein